MASAINSLGQSDSAPIHSRASVARAWYARRRRLAASDEIVITLVGSFSDRWVHGLSDLNELGFSRELARFDLIRDQLEQRYFVQNWREASAAPEVAIYRFVAADRAAAKASHANEDLLRPMYCAARVLVAQLDSHRDFSKDAPYWLGAFEYALSHPESNVSLAVVVCEAGNESPAADAAIRRLESRFGERFCAWRPAAEKAENVDSAAHSDRAWSELLAFMQARWSVASEDKDSATPLAAHAIEAMEATEPATVATIPASSAARASPEADVENVIYSSAMTTGATRVALFDDEFCAYDTGDLSGAESNWIEFDQTLGLKLASFHPTEIKHLHGEIDALHYTIDASALLASLRVVAIWPRELARSDVRARSIELTEKIEAAIARLREGA